MNNTNRIKATKRSLLLLAAMVLAALPAQADDYVFMNVNGTTFNILQGNTTTPNTTTFSLSTCVWSGTSGGAFSNGSVYINLGNSAVLSTTSRDLTIDRNTIYRSGNGGTKYYLRYNNGWQRNNTSADVVYTFSTQSAASLSTPAISGDATIGEATTKSYSATATYTPALYKLAPNYGNGTTYYVIDGGTPSTSTAVTATSDGITYSWSASGDGASYVTVNAATGAVTVNSLPTDGDKTLTLTCTASKSGATATATKTITLQQDTRTAADPTAVTADDITIASGSTIAYRAYTLTVADPATTRPYNYVSATSDNTSVATVTNGDGTFSITGVDTGTATVTLKAYRQDNTTVATTATFTVTVAPPATGISGGIVTLNDLEDHNWSYYQPASALPDTYPDEMHSPYPRNVKITYYGYGANTLSLSEAADPDATTFTTSTTESDVQVGIGEEGHTFEYYKTLERDANGLYAYRMIFNPFYVRPKSGSTYTGFYKWRVKSVSGGSIANSVGTTIATTSTTTTDNVWLEADETYYFDPTDNGETNVDNALSMAVEFEALWAPAEVIASGNFSKGYNSVERNFYVGTGTILGLTTPCTYSSFYPNGTTNGTTAATVAANGTVNNRQSKVPGTASADSKVEYIIWSSTANLNTGGYKLDIGRGVTSSGNGPTLLPLSGTHNADKNARLRIESGSYSGGTANLYGDPTVNANLVHLDLVLGSDYDRANGDNSKLSVAAKQTIQHGNHTANNASWMSFRNLDIVVKSGKMQEDYWTQSSATYTYSFYCRSTLTASGRYPGITYLTVEGGEFASINGGRGNYADGVALQDNIVFSLRMKGGTVHGSIYGAAAANPSYGGRRMVITGGMVEGWIAGGCNGTGNGGGATLGNSYIYVGGTAKVGNSENARTLDDTEGGNIFGSGRGTSAHGKITGGWPASIKSSYIAVADESEVLHNVYGGGFYGFTGSGSTSSTTTDNPSGNTPLDPDAAANIFVLGGTVNENVFGGGNNAVGANANITMTGGLVEGGIYGGSNSTGTLYYNTTIHVDGGQVGTASQTANIHGGGYGQNTVVSGDVTVTLGTCGAASGATVYGDVYGGSALGTVNAGSSNSTTVSLYKGTIYGGLYGGALGQTTPTSIAAAVNGAVTVNVFGGSVLCSSGDPKGEAGTGSVFGCNNVNGTPASTVNVHIYNTDQPSEGYALHAVYGGGNKSAYTGTPNVTIHGCNNKIEYVYGGGNAADVAGTNVTIWGGTIGNAFGGGNGYSETGNHSDANAAHYNPGANITADGTHLTIHGGTIGAAFGGSNQYGTITGGVNVTVSGLRESGSDPCTGEDYTLCSMKIDELYSGGNEAPLISSRVPNEVYINQEDINVSLDCSANVGMLFGGAKAADYVGNIDLVVNGGTFDKVFGGNNKGGTITGNVSVTFNGGSAKEVYGCCNESGTITGAVTVIIDSTNSTCTPRFYVENVYGGGNLAGYTAPTATPNYPVVNILNGTVRENVFGGGLGSTATVTGNPQVTVGTSTPKQAVVLGNVFGGGNAATIEGSTNVNITNKSVVRSNVFGGGLGSSATVTGNTEVKLINKCKIYGNVYGGGNMGPVNGNTIVIVNGD